MKREYLLKTLKTISPALSTRDFVPAMSCFAFDGNEVAAYDDLIAMWSPCSIDITGCVPGDKLLSILSSCEGDEVVVSQPKDGEVLVKVGKTRLTLKTLPLSASTFELPNDEFTELPYQDEIGEAIKRCGIAIGVDPNEPQRMGITLRFGEKSAWFYSTNNASIVECKVKLAVPKGLVEHAFILPPKFCVTFSAMLASNSCKSIMLGETLACAAFGDTEGETYLMSKLIPEPSPDIYESIITKLEAKLAYVDIPLGFTSALSRAVLIAGDSGYTTITSEEGQLLLHSTSAGGEVKDKFAFDHPDGSMRFEAKRLREAIDYGIEMAFTSCLSLRNGSFRYFLAPIAD